MTVTADDLDTALDLVVTTLGSATDQDWSALPGTGEWDCRYTAEHVADCLLAYAAQLVARPTSDYVRFEIAAEKEASAADLVEFVVAGGGILALTVRSSAPEVRAYHPMGTSDPEGFAGMGCVELLVHGADLARGLGRPFDPPRDVCARVMARMFPEVSVEADPWSALSWATGRIALPGHERRTKWRWRGAPLR
jgi:uncharacterized protein (TIGR03083 family)